MIREPARRVPVVMGREEPLQLSDGALRFVLFAVVTFLAGGLFALALLPATRAAGEATMRFTGQFHDLAPGDLAFPRFPERSTIYAADGSVLATLFLEENRKVVRLEQISDVAQKAVLAIEDDGFYDHGALDVQGIVRAAFANLKAGEVEQGGSTISQQLVKNVLTGGERTFARKLEEARLAFRIEREYSKDQILELYLNEVYMGRSVNGIQAAAEFYFGKQAKNLELPEAATLAGLIAAPERFNPLTEPEAALDRRNYVIDRMAGLGWITDAEAEEAKAAKLGLSNRLRNVNKIGKAPYFVEYIKRQILADKTFGKNKEERERALFQGGLKIHTTLEPKWLQHAKEAVAANLSHPNDPQSAVVTVESTTGAIKTLLGGTEFKKQKFDIASQGRRQPGSAFKPFTLVAAFQQGMPRGKVYNRQSPIELVCDGQAWKVHNAEGGTAEGYINLDDATALSVNVVFAQLIAEVGPQSVLTAAKAMGITSDIGPYCAITLGSEAVTPLEMASAYATLSNEGIRCRPYAITKVVGPNGKAIKKNQPRCEQAIEPKIAATVSEMLTGVVRGGTGGSAVASISHPVAGKTGTTQEHADGWFVGYTAKQLSTAVWVGDIEGEIPIENRGSILGPLFGGNKPASIWNSYMAPVLSGMPVNHFPPAPAPESAKVPNVIGKKQAEAEEILAEANFTTIVEQKKAAAPAGTVVEQSPGGGATVPAGSAVTIYVSDGTAPPKPKKPPKVAVPDVEGLGESAARSRLLDAGFTVKVAREDTDAQGEDGKVLDQFPAGGTKAEKGATVTIVVGRFVEPEPSPTPSPSPKPSAKPTKKPAPKP